MYGAAVFTVLNADNFLCIYGWLLSGFMLKMKENSPEYQETNSVT
jgi:hypothetical protein